MCNEVVGMCLNAMQKVIGGYYEIVINQVERKRPLEFDRNNCQTHYSSRHVYRAVASTFEVVRSVGVAKFRPPTTPLVTFHLQRSYNCIDVTW